MASTDATRRLTEAHRLAQSRLASGAVADLQAVWRLLDPLDIDATIEAWLRASRAIILSRRSESTTLAVDYLKAFRSIELGVVEAFVPSIAGPLNPRIVSSSLALNGPGSIASSLRRGVSVHQAAEKALVRVAGTGVRHTLSGGRDTVMNTVRSDPKSRGFARVTSAKPCAFCAMLAGRGPVYGSKQSASFHPHDACHCQPEPLYRTDTQWPPGSREFHDKWRETTLGLSGTDALNAFRRALA